MQCGGWLVAALGCVAVGCGPQVSLEDGSSSGAEGSTADGTAEGPASGLDAGDAVTVTNDTVADSSGGVTGTCGDGSVDHGEDCDDGNVEDADGCSASCRVSGTSAWRVRLGGEGGGYAVALDVRDGVAHVATQQFARGAMDPNVELDAVDREGTILAAWLDVGALADRDGVRQPLAAAHDGTVYAGYFAFSPTGTPSATRVLARIEPGVGPIWTYETDEPWTSIYGTALTPVGVLLGHTLQADDGRQIVIDWFDEDGTLLERLPLGATTKELAPIAEGAIPPRALPVVDALTIAGETLQLHSQTLPPMGAATLTPYPVTNVEPFAPTRAFFDGLWLRVVTSQQLVVIDELDHVQSVTARPVTGDVLWADALGWIVVDGDTLRSFDPDGAPAWSLALASVPRFVRADGRAGLFLFGDDGVPLLDLSGTWLEYVVR